MPTAPVLSLPDEFLALALQDSGAPRTAQLRTPLAGALLIELVLAGRVEVARARIRVVSREPLGYTPGDRALQSIGDGEVRLRDWLRLRTDEPRDAVGDELVRRGLVHSEDKGFGPLRRRRYPALPGPVRDALQHRIADTVASTSDPDERAVALAALLDAAGILDGCVPRELRRDASRRVKELRELGYLRADVRAVLTEVRNILADSGDMPTV